MTNQEAIASLRTLCHNCKLFPKCSYEKPECFKAIELAISALQEQEAKAQLSAEGTTSDLISRQDAIEVIEEMQMPIMRSMFPEEQFVFKGMSEALSAIKDLPSAQPEIDERTEEFAQNVPKEDLISRKAAIDVAENAFVRGLLASPDIRRLPSAQPEPQWIPVSERLPEEYGNYLISIHGEDEPDIGTINPNDKRGWSLCDANGFHWASDKKLIVTAWKPLPKPYRAERRTDEGD